MLREGDILFARTGASVGKTYIYDSDDGKVYYAGFLIRARINYSTNPEFIFQNTLTKKYDNFIRITSQRSGQPGINASEYTNYDISLPKITEQEMISRFLKILDDLVVLHQRKVNILLAIKKDYLNEVFPLKGENTPRLRFNYFTEEWEERKLKTFVQKISTGKSSFVSGKLRSFENKYPVLGSTNIIGYDNSYDYSGKFILTARVGANAGKLYYYQGNVKISDNTIYIQTENWAFTYYLLLKFNLQRLSFGTGQPLIKASEISKINIKIPNNNKENLLIGELLSRLDTLITLHQRKINNFNKLKKIYLHKMFL